MKTKISREMIESSNLLTSDKLSSAVDSASDETIATSEAVSILNDRISSIETGGVPSNIVISDAVNSNSSLTAASSKAVSTVNTTANIALEKAEQALISGSSAGIATTTTPGLVKPDGTSIVIQSDGTISAIGGGGSGGGVVDPSTPLPYSFSASNSRTGIISARTNYTVPSYVVGTNFLSIYLNGVKCPIGSTYLEVGTVGSESTTIQFLQNIPVDYEIMAMVLKSVNTTSGISALPYFFSASNSRTSTIAANTNFTVPSYIVGTNRLCVYIDGVKCALGSVYVEVGTSGTSSTAIRFLQNITVDYEIMALVLS